MSKFKTEQEEFWATEFGNDYIDRNKSQNYLASNINFFSNALKQCRNIDSIIEFGANIGMNLKAISLLFPEMTLKGIEINPTAASQLENVIGKENVFNDSIMNYESDIKNDVSLIKGVLIHINPE